MAVVSCAVTLSRSHGFCISESNTSGYRRAAAMSSSAASRSELSTLSAIQANALSWFANEGLFSSSHAPRCKSLNVLDGATVFVGVGVGLAVGVGVAVGTGVFVGVGVGLAVGVGVAVGTGVFVGVGVGLAVGVGVAVGTGVFVGVGVGLAVGVGVAVGTGVFVGVGVGLAVGVGVAVGTGVFVGVGVGLAVGVGVAVGTGVFVGLGVGCGLGMAVGNGVAVAAGVAVAVGRAAGVGVAASDAAMFVTADVGACVGSGLTPCSDEVVVSETAPFEGVGSGSSVHPVSRMASTVAVTSSPMIDFDIAFTSLISLSRNPPRRGLGECPEAARRCSFESGIMVL